jgi:hypothetical protein
LRIEQVLLARLLKCHLLHALLLCALGHGLLLQPLSLSNFAG